MMKYLMLGAAGIMGLTTGVHLFARTRDIMTPIMDAGSLHPVIRSVALVVWHMVTLILALCTIALVYLARSENLALTYFILALQIGFALIFLAINIATFGALFTMPQWTAFAITAALMIASMIKTA